MRAVLLLLKYGDFEGRGQPVPLKQLVRKIAVPAFVTAQDQLSAGSAAVQFRQAVEIDHNAVDAHADETLRAQLVK